MCNNYNSCTVQIKFSHYCIASLGSHEKIWKERVRDDDGDGFQILHLMADASENYLYKILAILLLIVTLFNLFYDIVGSLTLFPHDYY